MGLFYAFSILPLFLLLLSTTDTIYTRSLFFISNWFL